MKLTNMFQNLSIRGKITSGFVLMLILLIFLAYIGYNSVLKVADRVDKADDVNRLVKSTLETRRQEKNFILRGDESYISQVDDGIQNILEQTKITKGKFRQMVNKNQMDTVIYAVTNYQTAFNSYVNLEKQKIEKMEDMRTYAQEAVKQIEELRADQKLQLTSDLRAGLSLTRIQERVTKADDANQIIKWFLEARKSEKEYIISGEQQWLDNHENRMDEIIELANDLLSRFRKQLNINQINTVISSLNNYHTYWHDFVSLMTRQKQAEATMLETARNVLKQCEDARTDQKEKMLKKISSANTLMLIIILGTIVLSLIIAFIITNSISKPVKKISEAAVKVGEGDLSVELPESERSDELGVLSNAFRSMVNNLKKQINDIMEAVSVLTSMVTEISATTSQLTASSTETVTAISETTTTVEEVKQTAQVANERAKAISENSAKTVQVARDGEKSVDETTSGMTRIREQMEYIAESIMKLSEQSQAIGDIMNSINDLAEQSNLLAVNASIEAAKAGEEGKGFSVVAEEVKSLANQSKQATIQVREILTDIQKATSTAVMATEEGSRAVETGIKQAADAGTAIKALAESINEAAQATAQIGASVQQQFAGVDQVTEAIRNISTASNQNLESTKQLEEASEKLDELGHNLTKLVEQYKL
jgi:methyl-accepting chemotaxis protein